MKKKLIMATGMIMILLMTFTGSALADSNSAIGSGSTADVDLAFQVVIPSFVYFRIGTVGSVDTVVLGSGSADPTNPADYTASVPVELVSTGGNVTISVPDDIFTGPGTMNLSDISVVSDNATEIDAPVFGGAPIPAGDGSSAFRVTGNWSYTYNYDPLNPVPGGTYAATATYTVALP